MAELVADCPRCGSKQMTFDVLAECRLGARYEQGAEVFCVCRGCRVSTVFVLFGKDDTHARVVLASQRISTFRGVVNALVKVDGFVSVRDLATPRPPDHLPDKIAAAFVEGAICVSVGCFNAAGTMFRLCVDLATTSLLPSSNANGLNSSVRRNLGLRVPWLFDNGLLPEALRNLSACIKEDGNDGAHAGTLTKDEAADLLDFSTALLERLYTEPERLKIAQQRRDARRAPPP